MPISVTTLGEPIRGTSLLINSGFTSGANISALNVGAGLGVYKNVSSGILNFKSLIFGSGFTSVSNTNDLTINLDLAYLASNITPAITASRAAVSNGAGAIIASTTTAAQIGFLSTLSSDVQVQLDGKQATITGAATTIASSNLSNNLVAISNGAGKLATSTITTTELLNLAGSSSNLQAQINTLSALVVPTLITNRVVKWGGGSGFVNSSISDDGTNISVNGQLSATNITSNNYIEAAIGFRSIASGPYIGFRVVTGRWNMDVNEWIFVPTGLNRNDIMGYQGFIYDNTLVSKNQIGARRNFYSTAATDTTDTNFLDYDNGGQNGIAATGEIVVQRRAASAYDSAGYNNAFYEILVWYKQV